MSLQIHFLGPIHISQNDQPVQIPGHKPLALLAYLLVTGQVHSRQHLIDLLFDGPGDPKAALRWTLSKLRGAIGTDYILADRQGIGFNFEEDFWLDVMTFEAGQTELYRGDFLEGLTVRDAPAFDEWLFFERERLRERYQTALARHLEAAADSGDDRLAINIGHQLLQLDNLREEWHRAVMRAYARLGQRDAALTQFERCRQILSDEMGTEPAEETTTLYEQIRSGALEVPVLVPVRRLDRPVQLPAFLEETTVDVSQRPLFVARERELAELEAHLKRAIDSQGRVLFVTGEAGRGKTALLAEFAARAQEKHAELIVASGNCNAYSGLGDPYHPFREIMDLLSGDVESRVRAGTISRDHARRLWSLLPHTVQALVDYGSNLVGLFLSGPALVKRLETNTPGRASWMAGLKKVVEQGQTAPGTLQQYQFLEQYIQVLRALASRQPLLLLLDDLQWADNASISLLFYLGRSLAGSRILVVGAYRPSDLVLDRPAIGSKNGQHPLQPVLNEFKRLVGEIELDLSKTSPAEERAFVEALLDSEPNRLGESFRAGLLQQASGHPLFTVELLREMQARGDLIKDNAGFWIETRDLDWGMLPTRVEAVIEQRLGRLNDQLRNILATASVEGELFTVQVIARLQEMNERQLLRQLWHQLEQRHRLVSEQGDVTLGEQTLSRFRFRHVLFQQYLYNQLNYGERRLLHQDIAAVLEELYAGHTDEVAVQLARHYTEAGQSEKAIPYLLRAGELARLAYAYEAAIRHYRQAVILLKQQGDDERTAATLMKLGLTYHNAFDFEQARLTYEEAFALLQETRVVDPATLSPVSLTIQIALPQNLEVLDPAMITDITTAEILGQLFSGLLRLSPEMEVVPEVARSWQVLAGGSKYIFHLRDDVTWSDGVPVTAEDFEYAWKRVLQPTTGSPVASYLEVIKGATAFQQGKTLDPSSVGVKAVDAFTLLVELEEPTGYFLYMLSHYVTYPVPQHIVAQFGPSWITPERIVTNGPFRLEAYHPDGSMTLGRSPSYRGRRTGNVERVEISHIKAHVDRLKMYEADNLELLDIAYFTPAEIEAIRARNPGDYLSPLILDTLYVEFDLSRSPFTDLRVRQAFVMAIDRLRWAIEVERGLVSPALGGFVPPGMPGHSPQIGLPYDPERARWLLAKAGFPGGRGFPAVEMVGVAVARKEKHCQQLQTQWRENLGVVVSWETLELAKLLDRLRSGKLPNLYIMCWIADYPDPDNYLRVGALQYKKSWWNDTYAELVEKARQTTDQQVRLKLYEQADKLLVEEAVIMPLYYNRSHLLIKPWVSSYPTSALGNWFWADVVIDPSRKLVQPNFAISLI
jgi:ABC-type oligopeptide transport system substrate-binding subunit/DNA-binding SARP family transcriptional activator